ncbi:MAG: anhydro-N-acetylmuramic acid kinase [Bacteroidetes bacterium]|nr:anhydro-N-acetylmuramic acid kinase [Bacteroidota bacterium]
MKTYNVLGIMSGTSMDGIDLAFCVFTHDKNKWSFQIKEAETVPYDESWLEMLSESRSLSRDKIRIYDLKYGAFIGNLAMDFITRYNLKPDLIASHGHTILHEPDQGITFQLGDGKAIANKTKIKTINDFRSLDVSLGGQGAPLVPIGDALLFSEYDYCVNLGGFANISYDEDGKRIAFDICPLNIVLNEYSLKLGKAFDKNGDFAKAGNLISPLFDQLNNLDYYSKSPPKSLGKEWVIEIANPILHKYQNYNPKDILNTLVEHMALQISSHLVTSTANSLFTGGGTFNNHLINRIKKYSKTKIGTPSNTIVSFKEAMIFGFLGVLKDRNEINCLSSVTGAQHDCVSGMVHIPV